MQLYFSLTFYLAVQKFNNCYNINIIKQYSNYKNKTYFECV